jgi:hypothetical protein
MPQSHIYWHAPMRLLVGSARRAADPVTSAAAAAATEWLLLRSHHAEPLAPSRAALEMDLTDLLVLATYVPYGPVRHQPVRPPPVPWHAAVTALMPPEVRDVRAGVGRQARHATWHACVGTTGTDVPRERDHAPRYLAAPLEARGGP